jgi:hypothetical protein
VRSTWRVLGAAGGSVVVHFLNTSLDRTRPQYSDAVLYPLDNRDFDEDDCRQQVQER